MLDRMGDKYETFAQLAQTEVWGTDYRVRAVARPDSPVTVIAPHGGSIEIGTSELTQLIAGDDHNLFAFEGLKPACGCTHRRRSPRRVGGLRRVSDAC